MPILVKSSSGLSVEEVLNLLKEKPQSSRINFLIKNINDYIELLNRKNEIKRKTEDEINSSDDEAVRILLTDHLNEVNNEITTVEKHLKMNLDVALSIDFN